MTNYYQYSVVISPQYVTQMLINLIDQSISKLIAAMGEVCFFKRVRLNRYCAQYYIEFNTIEPLLADPLLSEFSIIRPHTHSHNYYI